MIKIDVALYNEFNSDYVEVEITKEDLMQLACNKARGMYENNYWDAIIASEEIILTGKL